MGVDMMEVGIFVKKVVIFTVGTCYRSACNHPFLVGIGFFFLFLYVYLPALFAFLLSSSPVLVCTAALLGTLLSFGNPNIPEIEENHHQQQQQQQQQELEKTNRITHHGISSLRTGVVQGDLVVEKADRFSAETCVHEARDIIKDKAEDEKDFIFPEKTHENVDTDNKIGEASGDMHDRKIQNQGFTERIEIHGRKQVIEDGKESQDHGFSNLRELHEKAPLIEEDRQVEAQFSEENASRKEIKENDRSVGEFPGAILGESFVDSATWKKMEADDDEDESSDSDSDGAESSSPDASMADIIPMLDELHPLLDVEQAQPAFIALNGSDAASERSHRSNEESGEDVENHEEEDDDDDEEEEEEEEEEEPKHGAPDDETKAVVTWTEDDARNLMDLGNSELERNRRLESLIARRRARKNFRKMLTEKNLIDFDASEPPFPIAPISTARNNPFDIHYDSNEAMGLPPIPGSAPSVLLPRRNPFDLPYDPLEERPDLTGGSFEEEFLTPHEKDMFFRRHESFSLGSSFFGEFKQEKQHSKFRPYFVPEHMASERTNYSTFQRQLSERSDSKMSSVAETESVSSFVEQDDHKYFTDQESSQEGKSHDKHILDDVPLQSSPSKSEIVETNPHDKKDADVTAFENRSSNGDDAHEREETLVDVQSIVFSKEPQPIQDFMESEELNEKKHVRSISSSSSEATEKIFHLNAEDPNQIPTLDDSAEDSNHSMQSSSVLDSDAATKVPVYDWSPSAIEKSRSAMSIIEEALCYEEKGVLTPTSSFIESNKLVEAQETHSAQVSEERTDSTTDSGLPKHQDNRSVDQWAASSHLSGVEENEMRSRGVTMITEHDVMTVGFSGNDLYFDDSSTKAEPSIDEHVLSETSSSSSGTESEDEESLHEEANPELEQVESSFPIFDQETDMKAPHFDTYEANVKVSSSDSAGSSESLTSLPKLPPILEKSTVQLPSDGDHEESKELVSTPQISIKEANVIDEVVNDHEAKDSSDLYPSISSPTSSTLDVSQNKSSVCQADSEDVHHDANQSNLYSLQMEHLDDVPREKIDFKVSEKDVDDMFKGIKEIDETLLTELDAVGDFQVEESGTNTSYSEEKLVVDAQESITRIEVIEAISGYIKNESDNTMVEPEAKTSVLHVVEASSIKDIDSAFEKLSQRVEESSISEFIHDNLLSTEMEMAEKLPVIESRTAEDVIFPTSKQDYEEASEKPAVTELNEETIMEEAESSNELKIPSQNPNELEGDLSLPALEARSVDDIDSVLKQFVKEEVLNPIPDESTQDVLVSDEKEEVGSADIKHASQNLNLMEKEESEIEERSLVGNDSPSSKKLKEEATEMPITLETIHYDSTIQKSDGQSAGHKSVERGTNATTTFDSELLAVEAGCVEEINSAFNQLNQEGKQEKPTHTENVDSGWQHLESPDVTEFTSNSQAVEEVSSLDEIVDLAPKQASSEQVNSAVDLNETLAKDSESGTETKPDFEGSVVKEETRAGNEDLKPESVETSEEGGKKVWKRKKEGSRKSGSSSSSSSSSSDSD